MIRGSLVHPDVLKQQHSPDTGSNCPNMNLELAAWRCSVYGAVGLVCNVSWIVITKRTRTYGCPVGVSRDLCDYFLSVEQGKEDGALDASAPPSSPA